LSIDHVLSLWNALVQSACPVALLAGDLQLARRFTSILLEETERHPLQTWHSYARCFNGALLTRDGDLDTGLQLLQVGMSELRQAKFVQYYTAFLLMLAESLGAARRVAEGIEAIDEAIARSVANEERWCAPELLRVKAVLLLQAAHPKATEEAERLFAESLKLSRQQGALSLELRTATSIAQLRLAEGRMRDGAELLAGVYSRFTEGFATADLRVAESVLSKFR
jgi:predicted ATPase